MKLYLVQHAEPKRKEEDPTRPLSERGRESIRKMARYVKERLCIKVERIFHSGKLRSEQTAKVLAEHLEPPSGVILDKNLEPLANPKVWHVRLEEISEDIMLVGHLPHLNKLTSSLLVGDEDKEIVAFKMGSIVCLERDQQHHWTIQWITTNKTTF